jgi:hypothetical protein
MRQAPGDHLLFAIDDTPTPRYGPRVAGAGVHHNPTPGPSRSRHPWHEGSTMQTCYELAGEQSHASKRTGRRSTTDRRPAPAREPAADVRRSARLTG